MDFEKPKRFLNYSNGLSKQFKLALVPLWKYTKPCFAIISVYRKTVAVSQNVFASSKVKSLKNPWWSIL